VIVAIPKTPGVLGAPIGAGEGVHPREDLESPPIILSAGVSPFVILSVGENRPPRHSKRRLGIQYAPPAERRKMCESPEFIP
jgi:hypothetical protein